MLSTSATSLRVRNLASVIVDSSPSCGLRPDDIEGKLDWARARQSDTAERQLSRLSTGLVDRPGSAGVATARCSAMTDTSLLTSTPAASPVPRRLNRPSWLDGRLLGGVALVLVAVLLGSMVVSSADHRQPVWSVSHDLAAGTVLTAADLRPVRVQLGSAESRYVASKVAVAGRTVRRSLQAGELLATSELTDPEPGVTVTIPIPFENAPGISRGERITLWLSTKTCRGVVLLSGVPVQSADKVSGSAFGSATGSLLVVRVSAADAKRVVSSLDLDGAVLRAGVLSPAEQPEPQTVELGSCAGTAR